MEESNVSDSQNTMATGGEHSQTPIAWSTAPHSRLASLGNVTASSDIDLVSQIQKQMDDDVQEIMDAARAILSRRNSLSLISRLPPEMLARIFPFLVQSSSMGLSSGDPKITPIVPKWFLVTHVCRHWRQVALDHPSLWGHDVCAIPKWAREQLSRSKQAPISIVSRLLKPCSQENFEALDLALKEMHRVQRISLRLSLQHRRTPSPLQNLSHSAPLLENLSIEMDELGAIPPNLLHHDAPRLAYLELKNCAPPQGPGLYRNLVEFSLHGGASSHRKDLLSTIASMSQLQVLKLSHSFSMTVLPDAVNGPPLTLSSSLHTILLEECPENIQWLWSRIRLPSSTRNLVRCTSLMAAEPNVPWQGCLPRATMETRNEFSVRTLGVSCLDPHLWYVKGWTHAAASQEQVLVSRRPMTSLKDNFLDSDCFFHFESVRSQMIPPYATADIPAKLEAITDALYVEDITAVHLEDPQLPLGRAPDGWENPFVPLRFVDYLSCEGKGAYYALLALLQTTKVAVAEEDGDVKSNRSSHWKIFPRLRRLVISRVDLYHRISPSGLFIFNVLFDVIRARTGGVYGSCLELVEIKDCRVALKSIDVLETCEPEMIVKWDEKESGCAPWSEFMPSHTLQHFLEADPNGHLLATLNPAGFINDHTPFAPTPFDFPADEETIDLDHLDFYFDDLQPP